MKQQTDQPSIFPAETQDIKQTEVKPKRRYRRRKKEDETKQTTEQLAQLSERAGVASANLTNQIVTHLPRRFFERKELNEQEASGIATSVAAIVQTQEEEQAIKFAKSFPWLAIGATLSIILLSRLRIKRDATGTDTNIREGRIGENNSGEETRKEVIEEAE